MGDLPQLKRVVDPIADDHWSYAGPDGICVVSRVSVGRPRPWPQDSQGDWICPVSIEHFTDGVTTVAGVGPVDALMNAVTLVKTFADQVGPFTPRATGAHQKPRQASNAMDAKMRRSVKQTRGRTNTRRARRK
jgi:hypothetical protein